MHQMNLQNETNSIARRKAEFQEKGVRVPLELMGELKARFNAPAISTGRLVLCLKSPQADGELIPVFIVNGKRGDHSPYHLIKSSTYKFEVWKDDSKYTDIILIPKPQFYYKTTSGNIPMSKVAVIVGPGHLRACR